MVLTFREGFQTDCQCCCRLGVHFPGEELLLDACRVGVPLEEACRRDACLEEAGHQGAYLRVACREVGFRREVPSFRLGVGRDFEGDPGSCLEGGHGSGEDPGSCRAGGRGSCSEGVSPGSCLGEVSVTFAEAGFRVAFSTWRPCAVRQQVHCHRLRWRL